MPPIVSAQYETADAIDRLTNRLDLTDDWSEDWALEAADASRISEFSDLYTNGKLSKDEKFALMSLIVASLDDYLNQTPPPYQDTALSALVERLLKTDFKLHAPTIKSWCHFGTPDPKDDFLPSFQDDFPDDPDGFSGWVFQVTPMMRRLWDNQHVRNFVQPLR